MSWITNLPPDLASLALSQPRDFKSFLVGGVDIAATNSSFRVLGPGMGAAAWPTAAGILTAVSTSASDTGLLYVEYIDADWYERGAIVTMTGTTPVQVAASARRVNRATYLPGSNFGEVALLVGATKVNAISIGDGNARVAVYTAPRGQDAWLLSVTAGVETTKTAQIRFRAGVRGQVGYYTQGEVYAQSLFSPETLVYPRQILDLQGSYGTTVWFDAKLTAAASGQISGLIQVLARRVDDPDAPGYGPIG